jgi:murein tripeptide amidase MpaA
VTRGPRLAAAVFLAALPIHAPAAPAGPDWRTPAETSGYAATPRYDETMAYLRRIAAAAPRRVRIEEFGRTGEGRPLYAVVVSGDGTFNPAALRRAGRPIVLIQNAIHAGEVDGKDACLELLRDMTVAGGRAPLLERAVPVIIPVYNADGHERFGPYNRINQNGPREMGWRTQAANLNLNRDYMKADAPETRALLRLWNRWLPDLYVDDHVTDGADHGWDVTYALDSGPDVFPGIAAWNRDVAAPYLEREVRRAGSAIGPYAALVDESDPARGATLGQDLPRFSTGYAVLRNRPGLLVETHMLKDYRTRVRGNYALLVAVLELVNRDAERLVRMNREADVATIEAGRSAMREPAFPLVVGPDGETVPFRFPAKRYRREPSDVSGAMRLIYEDGVSEISIPRPARLTVVRSIATPRAYIVPPQWGAVIEVLRAHGLRLFETGGAWSGEVGTYRCEVTGWLLRPFEGRQVLFRAGGEVSPAAGEPGVSCRPVRERLTFPAGSVIVPLDQPGAKVAVHLLEPEGPDSALAWGFFNAIFEPKEYAEPYVMETIARDMLREDPALRAEFEKRLAAEPAFAADPAARLEFFYRRSPWWDGRLGLYPVGRLDTLEGPPRAKGGGR